MDEELLMMLESDALALWDMVEEQIGKPLEDMDQKEFDSIEESQRTLLDVADDLAGLSDLIQEAESLPLIEQVEFIHHESAITEFSGTRPWGEDNNQLLQNKVNKALARLRKEKEAFELLGIEVTPLGHLSSNVGEARAAGILVSILYETLPIESEEDILNEVPVSEVKPEPVPVAEAGFGGITPTTKTPPMPPQRPDEDPIDPEEMEGLQELLVSYLPDDGGTIGNGKLREKLNWNIYTYSEVKDALIKQGVVVSGRGRGGSLKKVGELGSTSGWEKVEGDGWSSSPAASSPAYPIDESDLIDGEVEFLANLPNEGTIGNGKLRKSLGWDEDFYGAVRDRLAKGDSIILGRGRGGSVRKSDNY